MLLIILSSIYFFLGGLLTAALLTDKNVNTNKTEAVFCFVAGLLWPLAIAVSAGFALYENIKDKIEAKRRARNEALLQFSIRLFRMKLISKDTMAEVQKRLTK